MDVVCFHDLKQVIPFARALEEVSLASRRKDPFSTVGFIQNLAAHPDWYPGDQHVEPWFLVALEQDEPVGYLALRRVVSKVLGFEVAKLEFFVTHDNDCPQLVALPEREAEVSAAFYRYLLTRDDEWGFLEFHQQDPGSALTPPPGEVDVGQYFVRTFPTRENNTITIKWPSLEAYFDALSTKFRGEVRRKARRLLSAGKVSWLSSEDPAATPVLFELLKTIEAHSWKSEHVTALDKHPDRLAFFQGLLGAEQPMRIRIGILMLDGIPIAGSLCGRYAGTHYGLVVMFDDRAQQLAPGVFVQAMMLRTAIEEGDGALNLLGSYAYYKSRWLAQQQPTLSGQLFRIGKPWFWKAVLGDFKRRVMPQGEVARPGEKEGFNPERRAADGKESAPAPVGSAAERLRLAPLFARLDGLPLERLGPDELAALIPFGTSPTSKQPQGKRSAAPRPVTGLDDADAGHAA